MLHSYRPLMRFWAAVLLLSGAGAVALEALGPPPSGVSGVSGGLVSAPVPPAQELAKAPVAPAQSALPAAEASAARAAAAVLAAPVLSAVAAGAGSPPSPPAQPGPRKAVPPRATPAQRGMSPDDGVGPRYGGTDRRSPTRDIWGNPLLPPAGVAGGWADRPAPGGRGEGGYIGVFTVGPDGTRSFRPGP